MTTRLDQSLAALREEHPYFGEVVLRAPDLRAARHAVQEYLRKTAEALRAAGARFPATEVAVARECLGVLADFFGERGEVLAGTSTLGTVKRLLAGGDVPGARAGFAEDLRHLLRGAQARAGVARTDAPAYLAGGPGARRSREAYLERIAAAAREELEQHASGLDPDVEEQRGELERRWYDLAKRPRPKASWRAALSAACREANLLNRLVPLSEPEREGLRAASTEGWPLRMAPRVISILACGDPALALRGACLPLAEDVEAHGPPGRDRRGLRRRAPTSARLSVLASAAPWQRAGGAPLARRAPWAPVVCAREIARLDEQAEVREVRLAGGDPLLLPDRTLAPLIARLATVPHLERVVLDTRLLATLPARVTPALIEGLVAAAGDHLELAVIGRFHCPLEVSPAVGRAVRRLLRAGIAVRATAQLDLPASRRFAPAALRQALFRCGMQSCSFQLVPAGGARRRRVPLARALMESEEEARVLPGTARQGRITLTTAEGEHRTLTRRRDRQAVALLPGGERVYELLPRDRELASATARRYVDLPLTDYLDRLVGLGEDPELYRTIWYYF